MRFTVLVIFLVALSATLAQAQTFTVLYNFSGGSDGGAPWAGVIQDPAGYIYGTAECGGDGTCDYQPPYDGCGVVYKVDTTGTETVLHTFSGSDGCLPVTPLTRDKAGNIYGTAQFGGSGGCADGYGCGTVFKIDAAGNETVLYSFTNGSDGSCPDQGLARDKSGTLYGTTVGCYPSDGTIFKIDSAGKFTLLHSFTGGPDGAYPQYGNLMMDKSDNLYGVAYQGGAYGYGVLYELSKNGTFTVLHSFAGSPLDGCYPEGSVVQDEAGNFYGTASSCGSKYGGTIWRVNRKGKETILHNFAGGTSDGCTPYAGVTRGSKGNLYGVAGGCGANGYGALYKLSAKGRLTLLHSFDYTDGAFPYGEMWRTSSGTLFGTTYGGGTGNCGYYGCGTVWSYVP